MIYIISQDVIKAIRYITNGIVVTKRLARRRSWPHCPIMVCINFSQLRSWQSPATIPSILFECLRADYFSRTLGCRKSRAIHALLLFNSVEHAPKLRDRWCENGTSARKIHMTSYCLLNIFFLAQIDCAQQTTFVYAITVWLWCIVCLKNRYLYALRVDEDIESEKRKKKEKNTLNEPCVSDSRSDRCIVLTRQFGVEWYVVRTTTALWRRFRVRYGTFNPPPIGSGSLRNNKIYVTGTYRNRCGLMPSFQ